MNEGESSTGKAPQRLSRARSLPSSGPFNIAVFLSGLHYLGLLTTLTAMVVFLTEPSQMATKVILCGLAFSTTTWFLAFFKRRSARCPLCKGTPLINTGALVHSKAVRFLPLNHGVTATLSIIASQTFRCMYCGSDFDLLKKPAHLREP